MSWPVPAANEVGVDHFLAEVEKHAQARRRHIVEIHGGGGEAARLLALAGFVVAFRWFARLIRGVS